MRKFVSIAITTMLVFAVGIANGQGYTFRVLANKGQNKVKKEGATAAVSLKTGATLSDGDELIASQGAYIGLMHKSGKTLEVRTPGTKKVSDLAKMVNTKSASVSSRYATFLANKMNEKEKPNYRARLNATGAVSRALAGDEQIQVLIPSQEAKVLGSKAILNWDTPEGMEENTFVVTVKNIFDEEIMKEEVTGNTIELDFAQEKMKNEEGLYIIKVAAKENMDVTSSDIGIKKLAGAEADEYQEGLSILKSEVDEDSPLNKVIYASFYEENGLIVDALTAIEEAIQMNPEVEDFKILKKDIIERNGIKIYKEEGEE
ncbi:hypothetical protein AAOE16_06620 [Ekhidna sp. MALMAid0563]|uniref:hypothetical protein n=1 Tax=Ekhidna sp. MALMAid0563 TaxID=3143937 RepID=UPI0032DE3623